MKSIFLFAFVLALEGVTVLPLHAQSFDPRDLQGV